MTQSRLAYEREETYKLLSMMVPDALGNILTRLDSVRKPENPKNRESANLHGLHLRDWLKPVS